MPSRRAVRFRGAVTTSSWSIRVLARLLLHLRWLLNGGLRSVNPSRSLTLTSALSRPRGGRLFKAGFMTSRGPGFGFCWRVARSRVLALARTCSALARLIPPAAVRRSSLWIVLFWSWVTGFGSLSPRPTTRGRSNAKLSRGRRSSPGKMVMIPGRAWLRGRSSSRCLSRFPPGRLGSWTRSLAVLGRPWCPGRRSTGGFWPGFEWGFGTGGSWLGFERRFGGFGLRGVCGVTAVGGGGLGSFLGSGCGGGGRSE